MANTDYSSEQMKGSINETKMQTSGDGINLYTEVNGREESGNSVNEATATSDIEDSTLNFTVKPAHCFVGPDSSVEGLCERTKQLVNEINKNRIKDHKLMCNFKDTLTMMVSEVSKKLEERLFEFYSRENKAVADTLQELLNTLDRIRCVDSELKKTCNAMARVHRDMCSQPEV